MGGWRIIIYGRRKGRGGCSNNSGKMGRRIRRNRSGTVCLKLTVGSPPRKHDRPPRGYMRLSGREVSRTAEHRVADHRTLPAPAQRPSKGNARVCHRLTQSDGSSGLLSGSFLSDLTLDRTVGSLGYRSCLVTHLMCFAEYTNRKTNTFLPNRHADASVVRAATNYYRCRFCSDIPAVSAAIHTAIK